MDKIFKVEKSKLLYSPLNGIYPSKINLFTEFIENIAKIFFKIMEKSKIKYYVFAGSSIGLLRNSKSIPWVDDYDILIFTKDFKPIILDMLKSNGFLIDKHNGGYQIYSKKFVINNYISSFFQCDIFISYTNENNIVKNIARWGRYDKSNINIKLVDPPIYKHYDNMLLPFFNNYKKDVEIEYGNIYNNINIHISHGRQIINIKKSWKEVYDNFNTYKNIAINNTKTLLNVPLNNDSIKLINDDSIKLINDDNNYNFDNIDDIDDIGYTDYIDIMNYIAKNYNNNLLILNIYNVNNIKFILDIKYYFPKIIIYFYIKTNTINIINKIRFFINYIDCISVNNVIIKKNINDIFNDIIILNKPLIIINENIDLSLIETKIFKDIEIIKTNLKKGMNNSCVKILQQILINKKYIINDNILTNIFGIKTENAVKKFQKDNNINITGIVCNETLLKLME